MWLSSNLSFEKSVIIFKAKFKSILVYKLSKSAEINLTLEGKYLSSRSWIRFWESWINEMKFLIKGCKIYSTSLHRL